jgi:hypothetical protein
MRTISSGLWVSVAVLLLLSGAAATKLATKDWRREVPCAPVGEPEARLRSTLLSEAPAEERYGALFRYFAQGFLRHQSGGYGRVQYCGAGSVNTYALNGLEGFARTAPLLAAWLYSERENPIEDAAHARIDLAQVLKRGLLSGVDRRSSDYWGEIHDDDQRIVEAADIARILWLTRRRIWERLSDDEKLQITQWLLPASRAATPQNNWILFPITVDLVLVGLHAPTLDPNLRERAQRSFERYKRFYLENGWFLDDSNIDFYNVWGITYEMFWIHQIDPAFEAAFITDTLAESAALTAHLIGPQGIPIMGRSICYRTAVPVPVLAAEFLQQGGAPTSRGLSALDVVWRYFIGHDAIRDGALTQGYFGADLRFLDSYLGPGSCQWGVRSLVLAFMHRAEDTFWSGSPSGLPIDVADYELLYPKLGWRIAGQARTGEITIEILNNVAGSPTPEPYTPVDRAMETLLRRPFRPGNHETKYESRFYSSAHPFSAMP